MIGAPKNQLFSINAIHGSNKYDSGPNSIADEICDPKNRYKFAAWSSSKEIRSYEEKLYTQIFH